MPGGPRFLRVASAVAALVAVAVLLPVLVPVSPGPGQLLLLLFFFLLLPALVVLCLEDPGRGTGFRPLRLVLLILVVAASLVTTAWRGGFAARELAPWALGPVLLSLAGRFGVELAGRRSMRVPVALGLPTLAFMAPFLADRFLASLSDPGLLNSTSSFLLALSPWPGAAWDLLQVDLFKNEALYREHLIAEQLYVQPGPGRYLLWQGALAASCLLGGLLVRVLGGLFRRLLPRSPGYASIRQP
ncbi:MAG: hypothetical protein H6807_10420 [Planctomycetes bacterium]|nr:hypothetical protein [Planctomycetota bacterium]